MEGEGHNCEMSSQSAQSWRFASRLLITIGFIALFALGLSLEFLTSYYYPAKRPVAPQPERNWTVAISWTHPTRYGTAQEEDRVLRLFFLGLPSFCLIVLGAGIRIYVLDDYSVIASRKRPPWNHQWGP